MKRGAAREQEIAAPPLEKFNTNTNTFPYLEFGMSTGSYGEYEDGCQPHPSVKQVHGTQLIPEESVVHLDPWQRMMFHQVQSTIIDCYMIGSGRWQYFRCMEWHHRKESERYYATACNKILDWINSDRFALYVSLTGRDPAKARQMLCEVLNGKHRKKIESLLNPPNPAGKGWQKEN